MSPAAGTSLRTKLMALAMFTVVALSALFVVALYNERSQLMQDRQEKVRNLVEVAHTSVSHFAQQAREGRMSEDEARQAAIAAIRAMRYDKNEYFWINDFRAPRKTSTRQLLVKLRRSEFCCSLHDETT